MNYYTLIKVNNTNINKLYLVDSNAPNWELLKNHMYREGRVSKEHCQRILRDTLALISKYYESLVYHYHNMAINIT